MDGPKSDMSYADNAASEVSYVNEEESVDYYSEEDVYPLGFLDVVYADQEVDENASEGVPGTSSSNCNSTREFEDFVPLSKDGDDDDDDDVLEPVATVDVDPVQEEDFLPESMTETDPHSDWTDFEGSSLRALEKMTDVREMRCQWPAQHNQHLYTAPKPALLRKALLRGQSESMLTQILPKHHHRQQCQDKCSDHRLIRRREIAKRYREKYAERLRQQRQEYMRKRREEKRRALEEARSLNTGEQGTMSNKDFKFDIARNKENKLKISNTFSNKSGQRKAVMRPKSQTDVVLVNNLHKTEEVVVL